MYDTILLPVRNPAQRNAATTHAIELAQNQNATLHIWYVEFTKEAAEQHIEHRVGSNRSDESEITTDARRTGIQLEFHAKKNAEYHDLIQYAEHHDIDLIVTGTDPETGLMDLIGTTHLEKLAKNAPLPVLSVQLSGERRIYVYECLNCEQRFQSATEDREHVICHYCGSEEIRERTLG